MQSRLTKGLTDVTGIAVGHFTERDAHTGCTAIVCEAGAVPGLAVPGSATGSEETDLLQPGHVTDRIHGVVFAGGSAFGLEAVSGVRRYLAGKGVGFRTSAGPVPLVTGAILFDLGVARPGVWPTREMGEAAARAATDGPVPEGCVGAGAGATVGKLLGSERMMKSGVGTAAVEILSGVRVAALAAVNAVGDVIDPETGRILAGARASADSMQFADSARIMLSGREGTFTRENTTLVCVATDAMFTRVEMKKVAELATVGMARTLSPPFTMSDGDLVVALSTGRKRAPLDSVGIAAAQVVAQAIVRAVKLAPTVRGVPGLG